MKKATCPKLSLVAFAEPVKELQSNTYLKCAGKKKTRRQKLVLSLTTRRAVLAIKVANSRHQQKPNSNRKLQTAKQCFLFGVRQIVNDLAENKETKH